MCIALSVVFTVLGAMVDVLDLTSCALSSLLVVFVYIEIGHPYTWLVWLGTSLLSAICFPGSLMWVEYLVIFGIYPIIKAYIERLARPLWLIVKLIYINITIWLIVLACEFILQIPFFDGEGLWMNIFAYVIMNVAFVAYDLFISVMIRYYLQSFRNRIKHLLK